jgi:hypothetical protein
MWRLGAEKMAAVLYKTHKDDAKKTGYQDAALSPQLHLIS